MKEALKPFTGLPLSRASMDAYDSSIRSLIPSAIMSQAEQIVSSHRPEGIPSGTEPMCMAGLKPKDHGFLNGLINVPIEEKRKIYAQKRTEYADDPVAQQQIDVYDGDTEYHDKLSEFIQALHSGNSAKESELSAWFRKHYPDIK